MFLLIKTISFLLCILFFYLYIVEIPLNQVTKKEVASLPPYDTLRVLAFNENIHHPIPWIDDTNHKETKLKNDKT